MVKETNHVQTDWHCAVPKHVSHASPNMFASTVVIEFVVLVAYVKKRHNQHHHHVDVNLICAMTVMHTIRKRASSAKQCFNVKVVIHVWMGFTSTC
jgi:hypothetical protein